MRTPIVTPSRLACSEIPDATASESTDLVAADDILADDPF